MAARPGTAVPTSGEADGTDEVADLFRALGRQIKVARERAGPSQKELGDRLGYGEGAISSVERARRTPQPELLVAADRLLECGGLPASAAEDVERARTRRRVWHPEWFKDYARSEQEAVELHDYSSLVLPGLLQTEAHANVVFRTRQPFLDEATVEQRVAARLDRQQIFTRWPPPLPNSPHGWTGSRAAAAAAKAARASRSPPTRPPSTYATPRNVVALSSRSRGAHGPASSRISGVTGSDS